MFSLPSRTRGREDEIEILSREIRKDFQIYCRRPNFYWQLFDSALIQLIAVTFRLSARRVSCQKATVAVDSVCSTNHVPCRSTSKCDMKNIPDFEIRSSCKLFRTNFGASRRKFLVWLEKVSRSATSTQMAPCSRPLVSWWASGCE